MTGERAVRGGVLRTRPWTRAPFLLLRRPAVFLAVVAATAVLIVAGSSGVLFVSTLDTASLQHQAANDCPERSMPGFSADVPAGTTAGARAAGLKAMAAHRSLGNPYAVEVAHATVQTVPINLYSRAGALDHVTRLRGPGGPGVWIPDNFVQQWGVQPGGYLHTTAGKPLRVAGVYRSLSPSPFELADVPRYFCTWTDLIIRRVVEHGTGPLLIADEASLAGAADGPVQVSWFDPLPLASISLPAAEAANRRGEAARAEFFAKAPWARDPQATPADTPGPVASGDTLTQMISTARASRAGVSGSVLPIDLAGTIVAALLVAGAGGYWATNRAREISLLVSRGVGPTGLAAKAVLEALPAVALGVAGGFVAALALVRGVSPTSVLGPGATTTALWTAVAAAAGGLALIALIGAWSARDRLVGARSRWSSRVPWELALLAVAVLVGLRIRSGSGVTVDHTVIRVSPALVVFPLVGSVALLLLLGRLVAVALPFVRSRAGGGTAFFLAVRRIAGSRAVAVGLLVCVALPCALLTYTGTLTASTRAEVAAKTSTNLGAPVVLDVVGIRFADPDLHGLATDVVMYQSRPRLPDDTQVAVLGVDPASFARFALLDGPQRAAIRRLHPVAPGASVPALLVNAPRHQDASRLTIGTSVLPLRVVSRHAAFPGLRAGAYPMVVVERSALDHVDPNADRRNQIWTTRASDVPLRNVIDRAGYGVLDQLTPTIVIGSTGLLPLTWIFSYLEALAVMIGLVAVVGLVFALAARTRRRTVSYVMSRRMGLTRAAHVRSLLVELVLVVGLGYLAGVGVGAAAFRLILGSLDMYPSLPPPASFVAPTGTWTITAAVWAAVIVTATASVQVLADRARPAEILRLE